MKLVENNGGTMSEKLAEIINSKTIDVNGKAKLHCGIAFKIAEETEYSLNYISNYCNNNNVRIGKCQLGCFE